MTNRAAAHSRSGQERAGLVILPEHGVGAVVLTNADTGSILANAFGWRQVEVLFDGKPEAIENLLTAHTVGPTSRNWTQAATRRTLP
jgi:hypothetical protein